MWHSIYVYAFPLPVVTCNKQRAYWILHWHRNTNCVILCCKYPWLFVGKPPTSFSSWFLEFSMFLRSVRSVYSARQVVQTGLWPAAGWRHSSPTDTSSKHGGTGGPCLQRQWFNEERLVWCQWSICEDLFKVCQTQWGQLHQGTCKNQGHQELHQPHLGRVFRCFPWLIR